MYPYDLLEGFKFRFKFAYSLLGVSNLDLYLYPYDLLEGFKFRFKFAYSLLGVSNLSFKGVSNLDLYLYLCNWLGIYILGFIFNFIDILIIFKVLNFNFIIDFIFV